MRRQTSAEQGGQMWEAECYQLWFSLKEKRLVAAHMLVAYICMLYISVGWLGSFVGNLIVFHISPDLPLENHTVFYACRWWKGGDVHARVWRQWSLFGQNLRCWGTAAIAVWVGKKPSYTPKMVMRCEDRQRYNKNIHVWLMFIYGTILPLN